MDTKRKERGVERRHFTNLIKNIESKLESKQYTDFELTAIYNRLNASYAKLIGFDSEIRNLIISKPDWDENDLEKELDEVEKYEMRFMIIKLQVENMTSNKGDNNNNRHKLPVLELKRFNGNIKEWLAFWGSFKKIDADSKMDEIDKLQYLAQAMEPGSDVKNFVDSFPLTNQSYTQCIKELRSRYAREDLLIQVYVRELLALILNKDSNSDLTNLYDKLNGQLRALEILGVTKDKFSIFLLPMVESALPAETLQGWERVRPGKCDDVLSELLTFLKREVESMQRIVMAKTTFLEPKQHPEPTAACFTVNPKERRDAPKCIWCDKSHASLECYRLSKMTIEDRREHLKKKRACALCLKIGHHAKVCKAFIKCYVCGLRHSPVMCPGVKTPLESSGLGKPEKTAETLQNLSQNTVEAESTTTLLQTIAVKIKNGGKLITVRALLDSGSQRSYIKKEIAEQLDLPVAGQDELSHSLFGGVTLTSKKYNVYDFTVQSPDSSFMYKMSALEQSCICRNVPKVDRSNKSILTLLENHNIRLTDSEGTEIGLLIGADYSGLLLTDLFVNLGNGLTAIKTKLGWTLQGKTTAVNSNIVTSLFCSQGISSFWDLEVLGINDPIQVQTKQQREEEVIANFEENIQVDADGRYQVYLPWKTGHDDLQSNQQLAIRRLESTTRRLVSCGKFHDYNNVLSEWQQAGIIEEVPETEGTGDIGHYLPHRAVIKEASLTTKLRPVFDASAKDRNGKSLNSCLDKGINFLDRIPKLINGFRKESIGVTADIAKAFLQISVTPQDRDYLKFVWWKDEACDEIKVFRHCRVVFGLTSSPFLLSATILHHLNQVTAEQKKTADILAKSFYVDNVVTSLNSTEQTQNFIREAKNIMIEAKFDLRQWVTSSSLQINETNNSVISVLGLQWHTDSDQLSCNLQAMTPYTELGKITKRNLLSLTQKIFDPIGFTCPVTLVPRLILQQAWNKNITWDEDLPNDLLIQFKNWYDHFDCLNNCRLPRRLSAESLQECSVSLHMFCDASKDGYAACVFLRAENGGNVTVRLVSAKSRVSPPEKITIPRTELLSALIGSRLLKDARESLELKDCCEYCWTDSGVALCWIKRELPWNTYVGNRVKEIRQNTNIKDWNHIPGIENWADLASRGCNARQFVDARWWEGPSWLIKRRESWPRSALVVDEQVANKELKKTVCNTNTCSGKGILDSLSHYFSKYSKLIRMTAWTLRFSYNANHKENKKRGELTLEECDEAERKIMIIIQQENKQSIERQCGKSTQVYYDVTDKLMKVKTKLLFADFPECRKMSSSGGW